jgi:telomerase reverse transcriptase
LRDGGGVRSRDSENVSVSNEQETDGVLCRWTDDLLYVSASRAPAERFLKAATRGFEEHGCVMNAGKTSTNFDGRGEQLSGSRKCVAWCGLLIDSETLECTVDYARYAGDRAREAVTTPGFAGGGGGVGDPYKHLGRKICAYLRPKAIPLLYDRSVNSPLTAKLNVYQNFLMAAVKTHCYVAATTPRRPGRRSDEATGKNATKNIGPGPGPSAARVCAALAEGIAYMERATCSRASGKGTKARRRARAVARTHVRFLGLSAFLVTFSRKKTRHAGTVAALRAALATPEMRACARRLKPVLEDPRNDVFGEIRF